LAELRGRRGLNVVPLRAAGFGRVEQDKRLGWNGEGCLADMSTTQKKRSVISEYPGSYRRKGGCGWEAMKKDNRQLGGKGSGGTRRGAHPAIQYQEGPERQYKPELELGT